LQQTFARAMALIFKGVALAAKVLIFVNSRGGLGTGVDTANYRASLSNSDNVFRDARAYLGERRAYV
jgi:hypothetical protein